MRARPPRRCHRPRPATRPTPPARATDPHRPRPTPATTPPTPGIRRPDGFDPTWTPEQVAYARALIDDTEAPLARYSNPAVLPLLGYQWIFDGNGAGEYQHWIHLSPHLRLSAPSTPRLPESLVFRNASGGPVLEAAMYMLHVGYTLANIPPDIAWLPGWHVHENLCFVRQLRARGRDGQRPVRAGQRDRHPADGARVDRRHPVRPVRRASTSTASSATTSTERRGRGESSGERRRGAERPAGGVRRASRAWSRARSVSASTAGSVTLVPSAERTKNESTTWGPSVCTLAPTMSRSRSASALVMR